MFSWKDRYLGRFQCDELSLYMRLPSIIMIQPLQKQPMNHNSQAGLALMIAHDQLVEDMYSKISKEKARLRFYFSVLEIKMFKVRKQEASQIFSIRASLQEMSIFLPELRLLPWNQRLKVGDYQMTIVCQSMEEVLHSFVFQLSLLSCDVRWTHLHKLLTLTAQRRILAEYLPRLAAKSHEFFSLLQLYLTIIRIMPYSDKMIEKINKLSLKEIRQQIRRRLFDRQFDDFDKKRLIYRHLDNECSRLICLSKFMNHLKRSMISIKGIKQFFEPKEAAHFEENMQRLWKEWQQNILKIKKKSEYCEVRTNRQAAFLRELARLTKLHTAAFKRPSKRQ